MGKAAASAKRLELIEILAQGEKSVEMLAHNAGLSVKLASAHLKALREAQLVSTRREGKHVYYALADPAVAELWVNLRTLAEKQLDTLRSAMQALSDHHETLDPISAKELLDKMARGELTVIDVRPQSEYTTAHLPYARSLPLSELRQRLEEIDRDKPVVAYCRGPFCLMAKEAVTLLRESGFDATRIDEGVAEWRSLGLPLHS